MKWTGATRNAGTIVIAPGPQLTPLAGCCERCDAQSSRAVSRAVTPFKLPLEVPFQLTGPNEDGQYHIGSVTGGLNYEDIGLRGEDVATSIDGETVGPGAEKRELVAPTILQATALPFASTATAS